MRRFALLALALAALLPLQAGAADDALLARMATVNPSLHSYSATLHAHVALTTFPFLAADLAGKVYHKDPDLDKVEITSGLPAIAQGFSQLYPRMEPPSRWESFFVVTKTGDDGKSTSFTLVPRKSGNVLRTLVTVDDATATIRTVQWEYANGGSAEMRLRYGEVQGNTLVVSQSGHVDEPNYKGDITATLSDYQVNPPLPDSLFTQ